MIAAFSGEDGQRLSSVPGSLASAKPGGRHVPAAPRPQRLARRQQLPGEPTEQQLAEASDETQAGNPFDGEDTEDEGSYVPCPSEAPKKKPNAAPPANFTDRRPVDSKAESSCLENGIHEAAFGIITAGFC